MDWRAVTDALFPQGHDIAQTGDFLCGSGSCGKQLFAIAFELRFPDAVDFGELRERLRTCSRDVTQGRIVEHHIGRNAGRGRELAPCFAKPLEQRVILGVAVPAARAALARRWKGDLELLFALQDRLGSRSERQSAIGIGTERIASDQRTGNRLHERDFLVGGDPVHRQPIVTEAANLLAVASGQHVD